MPDYYGSHIFNWRARGWSENFLISTDSSDAAFQSLELLANLRRVMLAAEVTLEALRISDIAIDGDAEVRRVNYDGQGGSQDLAVINIESSAKIRCGTSSKAYRLVDLHGFPDDWVEDNAVKQISEPTAIFRQHLDAYAAGLINRDYRIEAIDKSLPKRGVHAANVDPDNANRTVFYTVLPHGMAVGDTCKLYGLPRYPWCKFFPRLTVTAVTELTFTVAVTKPDASFPTTPIYVRKIVETLQPIVTAAFAVLGKRDVGRAFFVPRGRAPARIRC